jgi:hypothetical protein
MQSNDNIDPTPPAESDTNLRGPFQDALDALQRERPETTVVDRNGNDVLLWLGEYVLTEYSEDWDQNTAEMYILVDENFEHSDPHWVIATPALSVNGRNAGNIPNRHAHMKSSRHGDKVQMVTNVAETDSAVAFSWRWSNMNRAPETPEDLGQAHQLVEFLLRLSDGRDGT